MIYISKKTTVGCAWIDEFKTKVNTIKNKEDYKKQHDKYIDKRLENLAKQPVKRKANIAPCSTHANEYFAAIKQAVLEKHKHHHFLDPKTDKKISIGVVRMANTNPCVDLTKYLLEHGTEEGIEIKTMAYHSRQVLLMRHEQEKYLDKILKRDQGDNHILEDEIIRGHIEHSDAKNIIFVLVSTQA